MDFENMDFARAKEEFKRKYFKDAPKQLLLSDKDAVKWAIEKAYQDMTLRTIAGVGQIENLCTKSCDEVEKLICSYFKGAAPASQKEFDRKHKNMCDNFLTYYNDLLSSGGVQEQKFGKAQKIINMTFKYLFCFEDAVTKEGYFKYCHMPLDSYILHWCDTKAKIKEAKGISWSKLEFPDYEKIRDEIDRRMTSEHTKLECEFSIWQEEKNEAVLKELKSVLKKCKGDPYFKAHLSEVDRSFIQECIDDIMA